MRTCLLLPLTGAALLFAFNAAIARAQEKKETAEPKAASAEEQMDRLVKLGPGPHNVKKDSKGRVLSLIVVGRSRISTVLGASEGKQRAQKRAEQSARAEFVKWLGDKVEFRTNSENETTVFLQGEEGDKEARSEAGKKVEKDSDSYKSIASGLVRGLTLLHTDVNAEDKEYTVVYGWSLANSKSAKDVATHDPGIDDEPSPAKEKKPSDKKIRSQKQTSPEAEEFLK